MIANIDENFGRLRRKLSQLAIEEETVLIFMTDNGTSGGCLRDRREFVTSGYNAGMRGAKASYYDGGHRVPFFLRWPAGGFSSGRDVDELALHIDLLPTFIELCGLNKPDGVQFDGTSLTPLLRDECDRLPGDRVHFVQFRQNTETPEKWTNAVMTRRWRLIRGRELYDIKADPGQLRDIAADHPDVVDRLRHAHEDWWEEIEPDLEDYCPISLGSDAENPTRLCAMDVLGDVAWHQTHIVLAQKSTGCWAVDVERAGDYRFTLRRWPQELELPIDATVSPEDADGHIYAPGTGQCNTIEPTHAKLGIFGVETVLPVATGDSGVTFQVTLEQTGITQLDAWFIDASGDTCGAYYVGVERL